VSPFERLLQFYSEFQACLEDSPEWDAKREAFEEAVSRASQDGSFNDQLPPDCIEAWVVAAWKKQHRER
jgi:hypothetical protein